MILNDPLTKCCMVNSMSLSDSGSMFSIVCLVLRLETSRMPYMSTSLFDIKLIGLEVLDLAQPVIGNDSQPYESN